MKKILNMLALEFKLATRDYIVLYIMLSPLLLAFIFSAVVGRAGDESLRLAVSADVPTEITTRLEQVATLEMVDDMDALTKRVNATDSIVGVYMRDDEVRLLAEGNEPDGYVESISVLVAGALSGDIPDYTAYELESSGSLITEIVMVSLILVSLFLGGAVSGFNIVTERELKVIRAISISPTTLGTYTLSKTLVSLIICIINVPLCVIIIGRPELVLPFALLAIVSCFMYGIIALILGSLAENQIGSIGVIKMLMPVFLFLPIMAVFVPYPIKYVFYPLPMFWQYEAAANLLNGESALLAMIMVLILGAIWFIVSFNFAKKKLGLRS